MGELVLKLTTMTPRSVILLEPCINLLQNFLKFQLIDILRNAGANTYRKQENSFYFKLFLYKVYLVLHKFIMIKQYDCPRWHVIVLDLHVGDLISLKGFQW